MNVPRGQTPERKAYMKQYTATHPKRDRREYKKNYDQVNKDKIKDQYRENIGVFKKKAASYYQKNKDIIKARAKQYYIENKDKLIDYQKQYIKNNKEKIRQRELKYSRENREIISNCANRRRASKFANGGSHTLDELVEKFNSLGNVCYYCGAKGKLTIDHGTPLSRGGTDNIDNILPACKSCNSKKRALTTGEYLLKLVGIKKGTR